MAEMKDLISKPVPLERRTSEVVTDIDDSEPPPTKGTRFDGFRIQYVDSSEQNGRDGLSDSSSEPKPDTSPSGSQPVLKKPRLEIETETQIEHEEEYEDEGESTLRLAAEAGIKVVDYAFRKTCPPVESSFNPWLMLAYFDSQHDAYHLCKPPRSVPLVWFCRPTEYLKLVELGWLKEQEFDWPDAKTTLERARQLKASGKSYPYRLPKKPLPNPEVSRYYNKILTAEAIGIIIAGWKAVMGPEGTGGEPREATRQEQLTEEQIVVQLAEAEMRPRRMQMMFRQMFGNGFGGDSSGGLSLR